MEVAHAFEQYVSILTMKIICANAFMQPGAIFESRIFLYFLSAFEFMHYFLEKLIMLVMRTAKHPRAMQIGMYCDLKFAGFFFYLYKQLSLCTNS